MFSRSALVVGLLALVFLSAGWLDRKNAREAKVGTSYYPRNAGCVIDGVPGDQVGIAQMHKAKNISKECYVVPPNTARKRPGITRKLYTSNPGCTVDGVVAASASIEQILHAKVISDACYKKPSH
jgi:hypothetical protein